MEYFTKKAEFIRSYLNKPNKQMQFSYLALRNLIGILGMMLPFVCLLGTALYCDFKILPSISLYYTTNVRDFFVGLLVSMGFFMITYAGYTRADKIITSISGIAAMGIAFFPCSYVCDCCINGFFRLPEVVAYNLHMLSAIIFFFSLAVNSICLFTKTDPEELPDKAKLRRNRIYKTCGYLIISLMIIAFIFMKILDLDYLGGFPVLFTLETLMLFSFGISWITKGYMLEKLFLKKT